MGPSFKPKSTDTSAPATSTLPQPKVKSSKPSSLASAFGSFGVGINKVRKRAALLNTITDDEATNAAPKSFHIQRPATRAGIASKKAIADASRTSQDVQQPTSSIPQPSRSPPRSIAKTALPRTSAGSSSEFGAKPTSQHQRRPSTVEGTATVTNKSSPSRPKISTADSVTALASSDGLSKASPTSSSPTSTLTATTNHPNPLRPTSSNLKTASTFASGTASLKAKLRFIPSMENKAPVPVTSSVTSPTASSVAKRPLTRSKTASISATTNSNNAARAPTPPTATAEGAKKTRRLPISPLISTTESGSDANSSGNSNGGAAPVRRVITPPGGLVKRRITDISKGPADQNNQDRKASGSSSSPTGSNEGTPMNSATPRNRNRELKNFDGPSSTLAPLPTTVTRTPASIRSLASLAYTESPGALTAPKIKSAAEGSMMIMDIEDEIPVGDISFTSRLDDRPDESNDDEGGGDEDEEGNVSALLPMDFGAPTPAIIRTRAIPDQFDEEEEDDDDDDDLDDGNDDDPTTMFPETPSRVGPRKVRSRPPALGQLPTRQNMSYLSPKPPSGSASLRNRPSRSSGVSSMMPLRPRRDSAVSSTASTIAGASKKSNKRSSRVGHLHTRPSLSRPTLRDRGSILSWEAVVERSKEFSEGELEDMAMISGIGLNRLMGTTSPGFGTPMYQKMTFGSGAGSSAATSEAGGSRRHSKEGGGRISFGLGDGLNIMPETPSPFGSSSPQYLNAGGVLHVPMLAVPPPPGHSSHVDAQKMAEAEAEIAKLRKEMQDQAAELQALQSQLMEATHASESKDATIVDMQLDRDSLVAEREDMEREMRMGKKREMLQGKMGAERDLAKRWGGVCGEMEAAMEFTDGNRKVLDILLKGLEVWRAGVV
ncbi:hypothetical protein FRB93_008861 [Tulasnella sp. JGI-2019a]|nr:hypothetical protein FRB93_008861 [Tulasnella sp. JGI-2019a]